MAWFVFLHQNNQLMSVLADTHTLLCKATLTPTPCIKLVQDWPDFVGVMDASMHGVYGEIIGENIECIPTAFCVPWPNEIKQCKIGPQHPNGHLTNSDLKIAWLLMLWLVIKNIYIIRSGNHVALFSDNNLTVHCVKYLASWHSIAASMHLTPRHIAGTYNSVTDVPSCLFGSKRKWHCHTYEQFLTLYNWLFPLPQGSWTVFHTSLKMVMKGKSMLWMQQFSIEECIQLLNPGIFVGNVGKHIPGLWQWTLTYRMSPTKPHQSPVWFCHMSANQSFWSWMPNPS